MFNKNKRVNSAKAADSSKRKTKKQNCNSSLGQRVQIKVSEQPVSSVKDEECIRSMGARLPKKSKQFSSSAQRSTMFSRQVFYENNQKWGVISKPYFQNYYNSLDRIGKRNLKQFLQGLNDKTIIAVSEIKTAPNGFKYIIVKYKYGNIETESSVWYMSGMVNLIELASKVDFQLDLDEIVKESYK